MGSDFEISDAHAEAVQRPRRLVLNFDALLVDPDAYAGGVDEIVSRRFTFIDDPGIRVDSIWWNWCEGNVAPYPSRFLPRYNVPGYLRWFDEGVDIVRIFEEETRRRGIEVFYSHRMNGGDNDPQYQEGRGSFLDDLDNLYKVPVKEAHPDWLLEVDTHPNGLWNFAVPGVRRYALDILTEIAGEYGFDGLELDFARMTPVLPPGEGWLLRDCLTEFMRSVRAMTLEVERRRGRPFLLAARVPENLPGCHFDGIDVETWVGERLIDILALGVRSFDVDVAAFRALTGDEPIKLYCALDDHHSSDGYCAPPIEVLRGVASNWRQQGADGIQTFNFKYEPDPGEPCWQLHRQFYRELSAPGGMAGLDKTFVRQRRGGGHGAEIIPFAEEWETPRRGYHNTNMLAPLPAPLAGDGRTDTLLILRVGEDVGAEAARLDRVELRLALHDPGTAGLPAEAKIEPALIRDWVVPERIGGPPPVYFHTSPPRKGIEKRLQARINNIPLGQPRVEGGWLVFAVDPMALAVGENLVGVCLDQPESSGTRQVRIEKLELHVRYQ